MKTNKKVDKQAKIINVDERLDAEYLNKGYFQDKIDKANLILKTVGLPKGIKL